MEPLYARLKRLREKKGLKLIQVSQAVGVPASTYRAWEYGKSIQGEPYLKIAEVLGVSLFELMSGEASTPDSITVKAEQIVSQMQSLVESIKAMQ